MNTKLVYILVFILGLALVATPRDRTTSCEKLISKKPVISKPIQMSETLAMQDTAMEITPVARMLFWEI
jgi:hypothetical protein